MAEQLGFVVTAEDKFTAPLRALGQRIREAQSGSADSVKRLNEGLSGITAGAERAAQSVRNTLSPALAALGVTSLGVGGGLAAIAAGVKTFSSSTSQLAMFSREVGLSVDNLRTFEALGNRFGISSESMQGAFKTLRNNLFDINKSRGEVWGWLQTFEPQLLDKLRGADMKTAVSEVLGYIERIKDPTLRAQAAMRLLGSEMFSVLGSGALGPLRRNIEEIEKTLGKLPAGAAKSAIESQLAFMRMRESMIRLRDQIGNDLAPALTKATDSLSQWLQANRDGIGKNLDDLASGVRTASTSFNSLVQSLAGDVSAVKLIAGIGAVGIAVKGLTAVINMSPLGRFVTLLTTAIAGAEVFRRRFGHLAESPSPFRGRLSLEKSREDLLKERAEAEKAGKTDEVARIDRRIANNSRSLEQADALGRVLKQRSEEHAEERRRNTEALSSERNALVRERDTLAQEGSKDRPGSAQALARQDAIRMLDENIRRLDEQLKQTFKQGGEDAGKKISDSIKNSVTPSGFDGSGGLGGLIHRASLGGGAGRAPGFGSPGARGGGFFSAGGGRASGGGGSAGGAAMTGANVGAAYRALRDEGMSHAQASALLGTFQQESGFNAKAWNEGEGAGGIMQWRGDRQARLRAFAAARGEQGMGSVETQARFAAQEAQGKHGERRASAFLGSQSAEEASQNLRPFVRWGETGARHGHAARYGAMSEEALRSGGAAARAGGKPGETGEAGAPLVEGGRYTSPFGMRWHPLRGGYSMHAGVDLAAKAGSAARARQGGTVTGVSREGDVTVRYEDGTTGTYRHINAGVEKGQKVAAGDTLGTLRAHDRRMTGPHLHYEMRDADGQLVNPRAAMDAGIAGIRNRTAGLSDAMKALNERGQAFAMPAAGLAQGNPGLQDAARSAAGVTTVQGSANLNIKFDNFPSGMRTSTSVDGMFKDVQIDRGKQMVTGPS